MKLEQLKGQSRKIALTIAWLLGSAGFIVILTSSIVDQRGRLCNNIRITINYDKGLFFVNESDIRVSLVSHSGDSLIGKYLKEIDFAEIEANLETNPFIENAEIYSNIKGDINVEIKQKEPIIRVVNNEGVSYYLDRYGEKIPLSPKFTARVAVASGNIGKVNSEDETRTKELFKLAAFIHQDEFWKAQFEQIYVTENGEFELIPKLGNHVIRLGDIEDMEEKFKKLMIFYKEVLKNVDADRYKEVNLKFQDQIVCTKNIYYGK